MSRNYGLDIFRIMCCLGVLNYHVMDDFLQIGGGVHTFCIMGRVFAYPAFSFCRDICYLERKLFRFNILKIK